MIISFLFSLWDCYMGPIWATRIWANPYGTHAEPGCTPHMGSTYGTHIGLHVCWVSAVNGPSKPVSETF